jgi:hypothetical protein
MQNKEPEIASPHAEQKRSCHEVTFDDEALLLEVSEGGGFTGFWQGRAVDLTGNVFSWEQQGTQRQVTHLGRLDCRTLKELQDLLNLSGLELEPQGLPGNMTRVIRARINGQRVEVFQTLETPLPEAVVFFEEAADNLLAKSEEAT